VSKEGDSTAASGEENPDQADDVGSVEAEQTAAEQTGAAEAASEAEEPKLRQRPFGRAVSDDGDRFHVSELTLGTWGLSGDAYGPVYHKEVDRVIDKAAEHGITVFETADVYGAGKMEERLGALLDAERHTVITKIGTFVDADPARKKFDAESLARSFDASHKRLGRDRLDAVLLHNPSLTALDEEGDAVGLLRAKVKERSLRFWGVSCGSAEVAEQALKLGADVIELPYNLFHQGWLHGLADEIASTDTAVLARSVLFHGLLAGHWARTKVFFDNDHRSKRWTKDGLKHRLAQLPSIRQLVGGDVLTLRAAALRFVLANGVVTSAVLGPRSVTQLNQLVTEAGDGPPYLPDEALAALPARLEAVGVKP
jgi:aryl-alcohol dehydrogenase-like predicted oxidoreductase